jgi:hypothetical protein
MSPELRTDLRKLLLRTPAFDVDNAPKAMVCNVRKLLGPRVKKGAFVFVIGPRGETLLRGKIGEDVSIPFVPYEPGLYGEKAVQERIAALLEASAGEIPSPRTYASTPDGIADHLKKKLHEPLAAIVANRATAKALLPYVREPVEVYVSALRLPDNIALGVSGPEHVGHLVSCAKRGQGIIVHGQVEAALVLTVDDVRYPDTDTIPRPARAN